MHCDGVHGQNSKYGVTVQILMDPTGSLHLSTLFITPYTFFAGTFIFCRLRKTFERAGNSDLLVLVYAA